MAWLTDWTYRKSVTLTRASGATTNYQMKLLVGESSGATGEDVGCEGKCLSSFNDLRFTTSDGSTLLDYWIESITGTTPNQLATIWIEFDSIGTSDTTFYMYYGNVAATAYSDGANTFIAFDDFEWGADGTHLHDSGGSITWTMDRGVSTISTEQKYTGSRSARFPYSSPSTYATCPLTASAAQSIQFMVYKENAAAGDVQFLHGNGTKRVYLQITVTEDVTYWNGSSYVDTGLNISPDTWNLIEIRNMNFTAGTFDLLINEIKVTGLTMDTAAWGDDILAFLGDAYNVGADHWFDNIIVRNWLATEPVWGTWGAEEVEPTPGPRYWIGNTGLWTDTDHWSLTSGGVGGASVPSVDDDVHFDSNSFTEEGQHIEFS